MLVSKKGMSALQIFRYMGFGSYKTAQLIRTGMVFKRGIVVTYHKGGKKYLHLYVAEFQVGTTTLRTLIYSATAIKGC